MSTLNALRPKVGDVVTFVNENMKDADAKIIEVSVDSSNSPQQASVVRLRVVGENSDRANIKNESMAPKHTNYWKSKE